MTDAAETMDVEALLAWLVMMVTAVAIITLVTPKGAYGRRNRPSVRPHRRPASEPRPSTPALAWPQATVGRQPGQISDEYWLYIRDRIPGRDGITWRQRTKPWKDEFRRYRRPCEIGTVLGKLGQPNCGPRPIPPGQPIHADHTDDGYRHLFAEQRTDVALGCEPCHATRERLKRQGVYIYRELAARSNGGSHP